MQVPPLKHSALPSRLSSSSSQINAAPGSTVVVVEVDVEVDVEVVDVVAAQTRSDVAVGAATSIWSEVQFAEMSTHCRSEVRVGAAAS